MYNILLSKFQICFLISERVQNFKYLACYVLQNILNMYLYMSETDMYRVGQYWVCVCVRKSAP